jgi:hypothetical protein
MKAWMELASSGLRASARWATVSLLILVSAGCGDGARSPTAPTTDTLAAAVRSALERSIQDEFKAETIYQGVVNDLGSPQPFLNVLTAEQRHSTSIALLFSRRGLAVPASEWTLDRVPHFTAVAEACRAAAVAERENVAMYDDLLRLDLPSDVRQVFGNNRSASVVNHLPAFERCS